MEWKTLLGMAIAMLVLSLISLVILLVMGISKKAHTHDKIVLTLASIHLFCVFAYWVLSLFLVFQLI